MRTCFVPVAALCKSDSWRIFQTKKEELETELWEHLFLAIRLKNGHFAENEERKEFIEKKGKKFRNKGKDIRRVKREVSLGK